MGLASAARRALMAAMALLLGEIHLSNPAQAEDTILRLAETATVMVSPDELAATLRAESVAPTAQEAERRVNDTMRDALASAKKVDGITVSTGGYGVWRTGPVPQDRAERWQAGQTIDLTGKDAEAMLKLVGDLQQKGLVQGNLGWRLSLAAEQKASKDATARALSALRGRADDAAELLGLRFDSFREVRLDNVSPPMTPPRAMVQRSVVAAAAPPPNAEPGDLPVSASAEADIVLKPRR
jgi:predicted secreted protein